MSAPFRKCTKTAVVEMLVTSWHLLRYLFDSLSSSPPDGFGRTLHPPCARHFQTDRITDHFTPAVALLVALRDSPPNSGVRSGASDDVVTSFARSDCYRLERQKRLHNARFPHNEITVHYPFHPLTGSRLSVVGPRVGLAVGATALRRLRCVDAVKPCRSLPERKQERPAH